MDLALLPLLNSPSPFEATTAMLAEGAAGGFSPQAIALTTFSALCAAGLALLMQPGRRGLRLAGTVVGLAAFAMLLVEVIRRATEATGEDGTLPPIFPVVFGLIALAGAARMITHPRPVFAALYFILVVIATAGMFLLLGGEFMAFSLIIVYAGAILITYMFVLMLAQQSPVAGVGDAWYDRVPREPVSAVVVGFAMLATLANAYFSEESTRFRADRAVASERQGVVDAWQRLDDMPKLMLETARRAHAEQWKSSGNPTDAVRPEVTALVRSADGGALRVRGADASVEVELSDGSKATVGLPETMLPENSRQVGVDLVSKYPAGLEIAGVVLLMALFGAVILARKQIELGEDERRELAGLRRFTVDGESGGMGGYR